MDPGDELVVIDVPVGGGDSMGSAQTVPVGLSTCYDLRFPELYRAQLDRGAQVLVIPAAWPAKRVAHWTILGQARAIENQSVVIQCNTAGTHAGHEMGGRSQVVDATGTVLATAGSHEEVLSVDAFDAQLSYLARNYDPISLAELVDGLRGRRPLPPRPVVLTFDDGYRNNLLLAAPLLAKHHVPATLFVTTGLIGTDRWMWAYELDEMFLRYSPFPSSNSRFARNSFQWAIRSATLASNPRPVGS